MLKITLKFWELVSKQIHFYSSLRFNAASNGLSIISKFHLIQWLSSLSKLETLLFKLLNPKGFTIQTFYQDINKHTFPQFMLFFINFLAKNSSQFSFKTSDFKLFCYFLCHYLHKSHNFFNSRKAPFLHKKQQKHPTAGLQFAKVICFCQSHITAIQLNKLHLKALCNSTLVYSYKLKY